MRLNENQLREIISETISEFLGKSAGPDAPSPTCEDEQFDDALYSLIDQWKDVFLARMEKKDFFEWCRDIIKDAIGSW